MQCFRKAVLYKTVSNKTRLLQLYAEVGFLIADML